LPAGGVLGASGFSAIIFLLNLSPESVSRGSIGGHGSSRRFVFLILNLILCFRFTDRCQHQRSESLNKSWRVIETSRHLKALDAEKPGLLPRMMINLSQGLDMVGDK